MISQTKKVDKLDNETYMITCMDGPNTGALRLQHLEGHLIHIEKNNHKYRVAGPMRNDVGGEIVGSFFLIEANSEAEARAVLKGDPYLECGMYASMTVHQFSPACGTWMGGVIWDRDELLKNHPR